MVANPKQKSYSLSEMKDKYVGKVGTPQRDAYEYEFRMDVLGRMIKAARQKRNLTQEQLGEMIGVQKAQMLESDSLVLHLSHFINPSPTSPTSAPTPGFSPPSSYSAT